MRIINASFLLCLWCSGHGLTARAEDQSAPKTDSSIAKPAPAFALKNLQGKEVKLADFEGKGVIAFFWASWDKPSQKQVAMLADLQKQYGTQELAVVGIAIDTGNLNGLKVYVNNNKIVFPVLLFDMKVVKDFGGITAIPITFVIDKNHNIISQYVGWQEKDVIEPDVKAILKK